MNKLSSFRRTNRKNSCYRQMRDFRVSSLLLAFKRRNRLLDLKPHQFILREILAQMMSISASSSHCHEKKFTNRPFCSRVINWGDQPLAYIIRAGLHPTETTFTDMRAKGGLFSPATSRARLDRKALLRRAEHLVKRILKTKQTLLVDLYQEVKDQVRTTHHAEYQYHQDDVRNDTTLLEWVLRPDYLDGRIPSLQNAKTMQAGEPA